MIGTCTTIKCLLWPKVALWKSSTAVATLHSCCWFLLRSPMLSIWHSTTVWPFCFGTRRSITAVPSVSQVRVRSLKGSLLKCQSEFNHSSTSILTGTLFALKVVTTSLLDASFGLSSSMTKWGVWIELLYISFITPNTSFVGHLAGILVGFLYTKGPLKAVMLNIWGEFLVSLVLHVVCQSDTFWSSSPQILLWRFGTRWTRQTETTITMRPNDSDASSRETTRMNIFEEDRASKLEHTFWP